jgi:phosphoglycolate phosphatase
MRAGWGQGIQEDSRLYFAGEAVDSLAATYDRLFPECIDQMVVMPGAADTLAALSAAGVSLAVVTNTPRELALQILTTTGLDPYFQAVAAGDEVAAGKPDPALLHLAAARLSVALTDCLFVGDTAVDVEAGLRAPCRTIGFRIDADQRVEELPELLAFIRPARESTRRG